MYFQYTFEYLTEHFLKYFQHLNNKNKQFIDHYENFNNNQTYAFLEQYNVKQYKQHI